MAKNTKVYNDARRAARNESLRTGKTGIHLKDGLTLSLDKQWGANKGREDAARIMENMKKRKEDQASRREAAKNIRKGK